MKQQDRVLNWLQDGKHLNRLQSWSILGVYRLSAVILILKKKGHIIRNDWMTANNQFGEKCRFANYKLEENNESK